MRPIQDQLHLLRSGPEGLLLDSDIPSVPIEQTFVGSHYVRLALSIDNCVMIMLPVATREVGKSLPSANAIDLQYVRYRTEDNVKIDFISVKCTEPDLESAFLDMVENICYRIRAGKSAVVSIDEALREFKLLLMGAPEKVDDEAIKGLFGELFVLNQLTVQNVELVKYWTGPESHRRDFVLPESNIEVKTSGRSQQQVVSISSLEQLKTDPDRPLYLWYVEVEDDPGRGLTVTDLVEEIMKLGADEQQLFGQLEKLGYTNAAKGEWDRLAYIVYMHQPYIVDDAFPRLVPESFVSGIPEGVSHITYRVNLDHAASNKVEQSVIVEGIS